MNIVEDGGRLLLKGAPFELKDEIKNLNKRRWHGFESPKTKYWSCTDTAGNRQRIRRMFGHDPNAHFSNPVQSLRFDRPLWDHQKRLVEFACTYGAQLWAAEMACGKTLAALEVIERRKGPFLWVGSVKSIKSTQREVKQWDFPEPDFVTYQSLHKIPLEKYNGFIFDESQALKNPDSKMSIRAQALTDDARRRVGYEATSILMSGTPSPKKPTGWWSQLELAWPGFLYEGSVKALLESLAVLKEVNTGVQIVHELDYWLEDKVAELYERMKPLVQVLMIDDIMDLPEHQFHIVRAEPSEKMKKVADVIKATEPTTMGALSKLRELSDGFLYTTETKGTVSCGCDGGEIDVWDRDGVVYRSLELIDDASKYLHRRETCPVCSGSGQRPNKVRVAKRVACPKDELLVELIENEHRVIVFAGFTESVSRCVDTCRDAGFRVIRCDGKAFTADGGGDPLDVWADAEEPVAFVGNPESAGSSFNLQSARIMVFYSNTYKTGFRTQACARHRRPGMPEDGGIVYDLVHLPSDEKVLKVVKEDRRLELMSLGEILDEELEAAI